MPYIRSHSNQSTVIFVEGPFHTKHKTQTQKNIYVRRKGYFRNVIKSEF